MHAFELDRPATLEDAVALLQGGARPLAGGQTLIASMKLRLRQLYHWRRISCDWRPLLD